MTTHQALVPGSSGGLPAHIEQRTRIANRVLGELERRDTEAFFRRHPEFFRLAVSRYYPLSEELIGRYADWWDWKGLSWNEELPWNEALIERFADCWNWEILSLNERLPWNERLIERYTDRWDWRQLSRNEGLPWSEGLIERYIDCWGWWGLSFNKDLPWSEALIERYADRWEWSGLSLNVGLPWSEGLIERYADCWGWGGLSFNEGLPWSEALIERYADRWEWDGLSLIVGLPWSEALIERYADRWEWGNAGLSWNEGLPWSEVLIERYADRWDWRQLSRNEGLPWSGVLIERYADRWVWGWIGLSENKGLPWSHALYERFAERWDVGQVASHYDGGVRALMPEQVGRLMQSTQKNRMNTYCYFCDAPATSDEHIPPKCLFPEEKDLPKGIRYRNNLITVPSCDAHNSEKSKEDEYLRFILVHGYFNNKAGQDHFSSKIVRAVARRPAILVALYQTKKPLIVDGNPTVAVEIDRIRFEKSLEKIVQGLVVKNYGIRWEKPIEIHTPHLIAIDERDADKTNFLITKLSYTVIDRLKNIEKCGANPEIFWYQLLAEREKECLLCRMMFYGGFDVFAVSNPLLYK